MKRLKIGGRGCRCHACGETFSGAEPFDQHRTGDFTRLPPSYGRSCRSPEEMHARGMRQNPRGEWMQSIKALRTVAAGTSNDAPDGSPDATEPQPNGSSPSTG